MKISHSIPKESERTYGTVPFTVGDNIEKITITYDYPNETKGAFGDLHPVNTIDIGLMNEKGEFLGWSGSARRQISVGAYDSTKGYLISPIHSGEWQIIVGAYHVAPEGVTVNYDIQFEEKQQRLLFGDLHIHSDASDGVYDSYTLAKKAKKCGLDFIALANHNNYSENLHLPVVENCTFIPAVEWTHYNGHMNFFGVEDPFANSFIANNEAEQEKLIDDARQRGAVISVNHPKCPFCPYLWKNENFDMIEIWNGPMTKRNERAIEYWTSLLRKGKKIPAVGGSDYHRPKSFARLGKPVTAVVASSRSARDILDGIKNGHSFITSSVNGVRLLLQCGEFTMGATVTSGQRQIQVTYENSKGENLVLVTNNGERTVKKFAFGSGKTEITIDNGVFFAYIKAVVIVGKKQIVRAITNPIYFK